MNFVKISFSLLFFFCSISAQKLEIPIQFGEIDTSDLVMKKYEKDPGADAVILDDYCTAHLQDFAIVINRHIRIKIINSDGFDWANVIIPYYSGDRLSDLKASTYNIENDVISAFPIEKKAFYKDKVNEYETNIRFSFPAVHEGSVIEYKYKLTTEDLISFVPWPIQHLIPVRHSCFTALIPEFVDYKIQNLGDFSFVRFTHEKGKNAYFYGTSASTNLWKWIASDVPQFRYEPYSTGSDDYYSQVSFELNGFNLPGRSYDDFLTNYNSLTKKLSESDQFGGALKEAKFLKKITLSVIGETTDELQKAKLIHHFLANRMLWNGGEKFTLSHPLKEVYKKEKGTSADINLLLVAMLRHAGLNANPVILSTRSSGILPEYYVIIRKLNYVVAHISVKGKDYLMDATDPLRPFDKLPFECLNKKGRLIMANTSKWVNLLNSEKFKTVSQLDLNLDEQGNLKGSVKCLYDGYDAYIVRKFIKLEGKDGYFDFVRSQVPNWNIQDLSHENLDSVEMPVMEQFRVNIEDEVQVLPSMIILNPFLVIQQEENPFFSSERKTPIDFGCPREETNVINITIPDGYSVLEKPSDYSVMLPGNGGRYITSVKILNNKIMVTTRLIISQTDYTPDDYEALRELYSIIIKKQSELVILQK